MSITHIIKKMSISDEDKEALIREYEGFKTPQIRSCFEPICVAMKPTYNTFIRNELQFGTRLLNFSEGWYRFRQVPASIITTEEFSLCYDKNFLVSKPTKKEKGTGNTHITVKPLALIEHLIKLFTKENSVVVDSFWVVEQRQLHVNTQIDDVSALN